MGNNNNDYASSLREYADWVSAHPDIPISDGSVSTYSIKTETAKKLLDAGAALHTLRQIDPIVYIKQTFGSLNITYVVNKDQIMCPAIEDGKVVWTLKPEFAEVK